LVFEIAILGRAALTGSVGTATAKHCLYWMAVKRLIGG
jgi:hypothetical protein